MPMYGMKMIGQRGQKMKRSTMIKKALNHDLNTVCVNEEQVERMLEVFEKLGIEVGYEND